MNQKEENQEEDLVAFYCPRCNEFIGDSKIDAMLKCPKCEIYTSYMPEKK